MKHALDKNTPLVLTTGSTPLDWYFVLDDCVYCWLPSLSGISPVMIEDNAEAKVCLDFLQSTGRCFTSRMEVIEHAKKENWPKWAEIEENEKCYNSSRRK